MTTPNQLACEEAIAVLTRRPQLHLQSVEDESQLRQLWEIDKAAYQDCSLSLDRFREWWQRYEFGSRILLDGDQIVASIGIYPIAESQALGFMVGMLPEHDLIPVSFEECDRQRQRFWYASGIVTSEAVRGWGSPLQTLLKSGLNSWLDSGHLAYPLTLFAIAEYEVGARLLGFLGFEKGYNGAAMPDGCDLYYVCYDSEQELRSHLKARL